MVDGAAGGGAAGRRGPRAVIAYATSGGIECLRGEVLAAVVMSPHMESPTSGHARARTTVSPSAMPYEVRAEVTVMTKVDASCHTPEYSEPSDGCMSKIASTKSIPPASAPRLVRPSKEIVSESPTP